MAQLKTKQKSRFKNVSRKTIMTALNKVSKRFLVTMVLSLLSKVSRKDKINALARIERAPKKSKRKASKGKHPKRKASKRKAKSRKGKSKRSKASIKDERLRNLKKARAAKKRNSRR